MSFGTFTSRPVNIAINNLSPLVAAAYAEIQTAADQALQAIGDRYLRDLAELKGSQMGIRHRNGWETHVARDGSTSYFDTKGVCRMRLGVF